MAKRSKPAASAAKLSKHADAVRLIVEASAELISSPRLAMVLPRIIGLARRLLPADAYAIWRQDPETHRWTAVQSDGIDLTTSGAIYPQAPSTPLSSAPVVARDVEREPLLAKRRDFYRQHGIRAVMVLPLTIQYSVSGTLTLYFRQRRGFSESEVEAAKAFANLASAAINTAELYEQQTRMRVQFETAEKRQRFLADISATLASSFDFELTLGTLAQIMVPVIADWCGIDILSPTGGLNRLAVAHVDPAKVRLARELQKEYPVNLNSAEGLAKVLRTGEPLFFPEISDWMLEKNARDERHLEILRALGFHSVIVVPLSGRRGILGAMSLVQAESRRRFTTVDLEFIREVSGRASLFVENAMLYDAGTLKSTGTND